jgi:hypothetical protein
MRRRIHVITSNVLIRHYIQCTCHMRRRIHVITSNVQEGTTYSVLACHYIAELGR